MSIEPMVRSSNPVDLHVGARVRLRRKMLGMSQDQLAKALNLTFQQVQKYERGANRISASKLYTIACQLSVPIGFFFDGLDDLQGGDHREGRAPASERAIMTFLETPEGLELAKLFPLLRPGRVRRQLIGFVRAVVKEDV